MISDLDNSFIRIRDNFEDATDTNFSPATELSYAGYPIQLLPGETTLQISNSPTSINLTSFEVHLIDSCEEVLEEVTENFFITPFIDDNGITQIIWEWVNDSEFPNQVVIIRFTDLSSGDFYYTNPFLTTVEESNLTSRFDYRSANEHEETQYQVAGNNLQGTGFYQSIRLKAYYNNKKNESERNEYHQISTNITISARNIRKIKSRYILDAWDDFSIDRLEVLVTNDEVYLMDQTENTPNRVFNSDPLDFVEREADSDMSEKEVIFSTDFTQTFTFNQQIYSGVNDIAFAPTGSFLTGATIVEYSMTLTTTALLSGTGTVKVFNSATDALLVTYDNSDFAVISSFKMRALAAATAGENPADATYYVNVTAGFFTTLGLPNDAITDKTTWTFTFAPADYLGADFSGTDYLTT